MRTHGVGVRIEDHSLELSSSVPYVVGFETPVIVSPAEVDPDVKEPLKLRWVAPTPSTTGSGSGTSSAGSSRARSLSGARRTDLVNMRRSSDDVWKTEGVYHVRHGSTSSEMDSSSHSEVESSSWGSKELFTGSNSSSPRSYGDVQSFDDMKSFLGHRRVESERCVCSGGLIFLSNCDTRSTRTTSSSSGARYLEAISRSRPEFKAD